MKKVEVRNKDGVVKFGAEMLDPTEWIAQCIAGDAWGKPERWVNESELTEDEIREAIDIEESETPEGEFIKRYKLPAEYEIQITDISADWDLKICLGKRKAEYPTAEEFLNAFFDGGDAAIEALKAKRLEVKAKYPKP